MERLKEIFNKHQKTILLASAFAGTAALGYYGYRRFKGAPSPLKIGRRDPFFQS
jgi:hypothetical protein